MEISIFFITFVLKSRYKIMFKKVIILLVIVINTTCVYGQNHMKYQGVELTGNKKEFVKSRDWDNKKIDFAGYKNCKIMIESSVKTDTVYGVIILVPGGLSLVNSYCNKYGPFECNYGYYKWEFDNGCIFIELVKDTDVIIRYEDKLGSKLDAEEREDIWREKESFILSQI